MNNITSNLLPRLFSIHGFSKLLLLVALCASQNLFAQDDDYWIAYGKRMNYELEVPCRFNYKKPVGKNIDLNFVDDRGNNINVLIVSFPGLTEKITIHGLASIPDELFVEDMEGIGLNNVRVIKRGITRYGGREYYFAYYTTSASGGNGKSAHYHHQISQIKDNTMVTLSYSCDPIRKDREMPYIYRVMQSFKIGWK